MRNEQRKDGNSIGSTKSNSGRKMNKMKIKQKKIIVHLKHPAIPKEGFHACWLYIAKHSTLCWTTITENMEVTDDISKVTCKKCLKTFAKYNRDTKQKGKRK